MTTSDSQEALFVPIGILLSVEISYHQIVQNFFSFKDFDNLFSFKYTVQYVLRKSERCLQI
jgi:hypothetical protein